MTQLSEDYLSDPHHCPATPPPRRSLRQLLASNDGGAILNCHDSMPGGGCLHAWLPAGFSPVHACRIHVLDPTHLCGLSPI